MSTIVRSNAEANKIGALVAERGFKNYIINGGFDIWQRGTAFTGAVGGVFFSDRWVISTNGVSCDAGKYTEVNGDISAYVTSKDATNQNYFGFRTLLEDAMKFQGKTFTLSFEAVSNLTNDIYVYFGRLYNTSDGYSYQHTTVGAGTSGYTKYTCTFTVPSWVNDGKPTYESISSRIDLQIRFNTNETGTLRLKNVQLEEGPVATPFEQRPIGLELSLCQRYYERMTSSTASALCTLANNGNESWMGAFLFSTKKRVIPTITPSSQDAIAGSALLGGATSIGTTWISELGARLGLQADSGTTGDAAVCYIVSNGYIEIDAEL